MKVSVTQLCPTLCDPIDCSPRSSSVMGFSRQEYWSGLPFPSPKSIFMKIHYSRARANTYNGKWNKKRRPRSSKRNKPKSYCLKSMRRLENYETKKGVKVLVAQSCPTICDPMDCSPPGSSVHGIFQARILEWIAISFSRGSSRPRDGTGSLVLQADSLLTELRGKPS